CLYTFTCFSGVFELSGNPEDLDYLQKIGIGLRRAQGFGMVEVV
ncbi:MAG: CRISPR-associated endoribonuclease Cas6, partial [Elusimicrobiota bacterium]|nr:CRISPR-associated endoribonuclease Cas6 [Endomicrobiia bacterium]MDW8166429.1 CRISPR-associated endoribonuclease Cas6 [Elusimicrobiota bacterium]